jgi:hypothetical protein
MTNSRVHFASDLEREAKLGVLLMMLVCRLGRENQKLPEEILHNIRVY